MRRLWTAILATALLLGPASRAMATPEAALTPIQDYTTPKAKSLGVAYQKQLLQFSEQIYHCLPWLDVGKGGLGFKKPVKSETDDRYLSLWLTIDQTDDDKFKTMSLEQRVSAMFSRYGVDMLRRMTQIPGVMGDPNVYGFAVILNWLKPGTGTAPQTVAETVSFFIDKKSLAEFLDHKLPTPEFVQRAKVDVFEGKTSVGRVPMDIWEDNFNSTYKLKNYEVAKGQKC